MLPRILAKVQGTPPIWVDLVEHPDAIATLLGMQDWRVKPQWEVVASEGFGKIDLSKHSNSDFMPLREAAITIASLGEAMQAFLTFYEGTLEDLEFDFDAAYLGETPQKPDPSHKVITRKGKDYSFSLD